MNSAQDISITSSGATPDHTPPTRSGIHSSDRQRPHVLGKSVAFGPYQTSYLTTEHASVGEPRKELEVFVREGMRKVTEQVINEYQSFFKKHASDKDKKDGVLELLEKKLTQSTPARPFFTYSIHQYLIQKQPISENPALESLLQYCMPLISEAVICVQYYDNHILDNKYNVSTAEAIRQTRHKAYQLKKILYAYVDSRFSQSPELKNKIKTEYLNRVFLFVDLGQKMELEFNHAHYLLTPKNKNIHIKDFVINYLDEVDSGKFENLNEKEQLIRDNIRVGFLEFNYGDTFHNKEQIANELSKHAAGIAELSEVKKLLEVFQEDAWFLKLYFQRVSITSGFLYYSTVKFFLDMLNVNNNLQFELLQFARYFGIMRQVVNDNTDILPSNFNESSKAKVKNDALSDLRNGNITLPIYLLWVIRNKNGFLSFLFRNSSKIFRNGVPRIVEKTLFNAFTESYAIYISLAIGKELAARASAYLEPGLSNKYTLYLDYMTRGLAGNNKFYRHYYHEEAYYAYKKLKNQIRGQLNVQDKQKGSCVIELLSYLVNTSKDQIPIPVEVSYGTHFSLLSMPTVHSRPCLVKKWKSLKLWFTEQGVQQCIHVKIHLKNLFSHTILSKLACD